MWLDSFDDRERVILIAIAALASDLPKRLEHYTQAFVQINRSYFSRVEKVVDHNPSGGSVMTPSRKGK